MSRPAEETQEKPDEEDKDTEGEFEIYCEDSWDCVRPGEQTTASWQFSIPDNDTENILWTIDGPDIEENGNGTYASCTTADTIAQGEHYSYVCEGTYQGKTVSSTFNLYCEDVDICAKEGQVQIPGFEVIILISITILCSIVIVINLMRSLKKT